MCLRDYYIYLSKDYYFSQIFNFNSLRDFIIPQFISNMSLFYHFITYLTPLTYFHLSPFLSLISLQTYSSKFQEFVLKFHWVLFISISPLTIPISLTLSPLTTLWSLQSIFWTFFLNLLSIQEVRFFIFHLSKTIPIYFPSLLFPPKALNSGIKALNSSLLAHQFTFKSPHYLLRGCFFSLLNFLLLITQVSI